MLREHTMQIRVRYHDTDAQGRVHHGTYVNYFEVGRVELLRAAGQSYRDLEDSGFMLVVSELDVQYVQGAMFDDLLTLTTRTVKARGARIVHQYRLERNGETICTGSTTVACVGPDGSIKRLPNHLRDPQPKEAPN